MSFRATVICLSLMIVFIDSRRIENSVNNVVKREYTDNLFQDWVLSKNNGEHNAEVTQGSKKKVKKRLALPLNYVKRHAKPEDDDYFERGTGEGEGLDYYNRAEWSGTSGQVKQIENVATPKPTDTDIESLLNILSIGNKNKSSSIAPATITPPKTNKKHKRRKHKHSDDYSGEDGVDIEEPKLVSSTTPKAQKEDRKARIMESVEELKQRHALEERFISDRAREGILNMDALDRESVLAEEAMLAKYKLENKKGSAEYEDYSDGSSEDKYKIKPLKHAKPKTTTSAPTEKSSTDTTTRTPAEKLSVFRHPNVYMVYDYDSSLESTTQVSSTSPKLSSTSTSPKISDTTTISGSTTEENDRISFIPLENELKDGEPTLFFPKKTKTKRRGASTRKFSDQRQRSQSPIPKRNNKLPTDSFIAASVLDKKNLSASHVPVDTSGSASETGSTGSGSVEVPSGGSTGSGEADVTAIAKPDDIVPAASDHKDEHKDHKREHERGGEKEHHSEHHSEHGESGKKYYDVNRKRWFNPSPRRAKDAKKVENVLGWLTTTPTSNVLPTLPIKRAKWTFLKNNLPNSYSSVTAKSNPTTSRSIVTSTSSSVTANTTLPVTLKSNLSSTKNSSTNLNLDILSQESLLNSSTVPNLPSQFKLDPSRKQRTSLSNHSSLKPIPWYYNTPISGSEGVHKDTKTEKGHHDKEDHLGNYHDHGGIDKHHNDESKHYGKHEHEEHGKKHAEYEESGKHSKGHSTKGSHDIHKKEEYEKKVEFFEEEGDSAEEEKHGGHSEQHEHKKGGEFHKGNLKAGFSDHAKGESGSFNKGHHNGKLVGHKASQGLDLHGKHGAQKGTKVAQEGGKKWIYHHGYPARTAHLSPIDRRTDQLYHAPQYFGSPLHPRH